MEQHLQELINKIPTGLLIGDTWREGSAGETFDVLNPATEEKLTTLASATPEDAIAALDAACHVQDQWAHTPPRERAEILRRAYDLITDRSEEFATLMTLEMGKPPRRITRRSSLRSRILTMVLRRNRTRLRTLPAHTRR